MYLYIGTTPYYQSQQTFKIGCTQNFKNRLFQYHTCHPPFDRFDYIRIWKTTANSKEELYEYEEKVFDVFSKFRLCYRIRGDTEWFKFYSERFLDMLHEYISSQSWYSRLIDKDEYLELMLPKKNHLEGCHRNNKFIKSKEERNIQLDNFQHPLIESLKLFISNKEQRAGTFCSPCGTGKTRMAVKSMNDILSKSIVQVIICCPSIKIQRQWKKTLKYYSNIDSSNIHLIGSSKDATTNFECIQNIVHSRIWCILTTYMSCHLLYDILTPEISMIVFDEAHHMAGNKPVELLDTGEGRTRKLLLKSIELDLKRLFITFTPKNIQDRDEQNVLSMDNEKVFGNLIESVSLRKCIEMGILPDLRIWRLYQQENTETKDTETKDIDIKIQSFLEAWNETHIIKHEETYILHHMIIFAPTIEESKYISNRLKEKIHDGDGDETTIIIHIDQSSNTSKQIRKFEKAKRAILVNCYVLGEGVDIPIANSVTFMYPKQSRIQITQMILRAGRWYNNKPLSHILLPTINDDDMSGYEEVLLSLAQYDPMIEHEIMTFGNRTTQARNEHITLQELLNESPTRLMNIGIDQYDSSEKSIKECFKRIRKRMIGNGGYRYIRDLCQREGIKTRIEYEEYQKHKPELPDDPRFNTTGMTWFKYLNPYREILSLDEFGELIQRHNLTTSVQYQEWYDTNYSQEIKDECPSIQNINDGCFGENLSNFNKVLSTIRPKRKRR